MSYNPGGTSGEHDDDPGVMRFGPDWTPPATPGTASEYRSLLHSLLKVLAWNAGSFSDYPEEQRRAAKISLSEWTHGIYDSPESRDVLADVENLLRINGIAESLDELWSWYDDPNT